MTYCLAFVFLNKAFKSFQRIFFMSFIKNNVSEDPELPVFVGKGIS
jgi:hypothetical protein